VFFENYKYKQLAISTSKPRQNIKVKTSLKCYFVLFSFHLKSTVTYINTSITLVMSSFCCSLDTVKVTLAVAINCRMWSSPFQMQMKMFILCRPRS